MAGRTDGLIKNFRSSAAIGARLIVKFGAADDTIALATAATDASIGVTGELAAASGERADVMMGDIVEIVLGGNVARGDKLTSDGQGRAVTAAPGAGVTHHIIGFALASGVLGDWAPVRFAPSMLKG